MRDKRTKFLALSFLFLSLSFVDKSKRNFGIVHMLSEETNIEYKENYAAVSRKSCTIFTLWHAVREAES